MSTALRAMHRTPMTPSSAVDDIPFLTRALSQIHADSTRMLAARASSTSPSAAIHAPAVRLFSALGFEVDRLRLAIAALLSAPVFVDSPIRPVPPFRNPSWLGPRAIDDARLTLNAMLRQSASTALEKDLVVATSSLVDTLSKLYPIETTPIKPRVQGSKHAPLSVSTPNAATTRRPRTPSSVTGSVTPAVAALPLPESYLSASAAIATHGEALSAPALMYEAAVNADDVPHFINTLDILARVARFPHSVPLCEEMFVWASRTALEDQFAATVPGLPDSPRFASPQAVLPAIEDFVNSKFSNASRNSATGIHVRPSIWPFVFYCLRTGALSAAIHLLRRASSVPAEFFEWFENGRDQVNRSFIEKCAKCFSDGSLIDISDDLPMIAGCLSDEKMYEAVAAEFHSASMSSDDAYMRACYVLLMRLGLRSPASVASSESLKESTYLLSQKMSTAGGKHERFSIYFNDDDFEEVFPSVEDYLWLKLWLCRTANERDLMDSLPHSSFLTLGAVQSEILACGESHFDPDGSQTLLYSFVLSASIQFERAVAYLYDHQNEHWLHYAVHLAMVLYHKGWVSSKDWYEQVIGRYMEQLAKHSVVDSAVYVLTVQNKDRVGQYLVELITSSGEYDVLLGRIGENNGAIAALLAASGADTPSEFDMDDLSKVREKAGCLGAAEAVSRGEYTRAAELLEIAGRMWEALEMRACDAANEVHKLSSGRRSGVMLSVRRALHSSGVWHQTSFGEESKVKRSLALLLKMGGCFEDYWTGRYAAAWAALHEIDLIPMSQAEVTTSERLVNEVSRLWKLPSQNTNDKIAGPVMISASVIEIVKVALHIAEYALESGSVRNDQGEEQLGPDAGNVLERVPTVEEIRTIAVFATMMRCDDKAMDERLSRIEALLSSILLQIREY